MLRLGCSKLGACGMALVADALEHRCTGAPMHWSTDALEG